MRYVKLRFQLFFQKNTKDKRAEEYYSKRISQIFHNNSQQHAIPAIVMK